MGVNSNSKTASNEDTFRDARMKFLIQVVCRIDKDGGGTRQGKKCLVLVLYKNSHLVHQKPMCRLNLDNLMDVQERHITNGKFRDSGVQGGVKQGIIKERIAILPPPSSQPLAISAVFYQSSVLPITCVLRIRLRIPPHGRGHSRTRVDSPDKMAGRGGDASR
ncbi:hypothetical protein J6590_035935 [Homalodisca vitripennis]|nr:hypothetical protein J6590_035935 [Homalodisca vitripennis]